MRNFSRQCFRGCNPSVECGAVIDGRYAELKRVKQILYTVKQWEVPACACDPGLIST